MKYYYLESEEVNLYPIESVFDEEDITDELLLDIDITQFLYIGEFKKWEDAVAHIIKYGYLSLKERG
jgi:hypothetical protein